MLEEIRIRDLGVIAEAEVEFGPGLTVLTGETGAGKTMILTALSMVMGEKVDASIVRTGAERAVCAATFAASPSLLERASELGASVEDGLLLARMLTSEGRSRALIGGAAAPAATLSEFAEALLTVHGQGSATRLLRPSIQRDLVDRFGSLMPLREQHRMAFEEVRDLERQIDELSGDRAAIAIEIERLKELIHSVEQVAPQEGEISTLAAEIERLGHADQLGAAAGSAHSILVDDESGVSGALAAAQRLLDHSIDPDLARLGAELGEIGVRASELAKDLRGYLDSLEADPGRLEAAHSRMSQLQTLARRWGVTADDAGLSALLEQYSAAGLRLLDLDGGDDRLAVLRDQLERVRADRDQLAERISQARRAAAGELSQQVSVELRALAMPDTSFVVTITRGSHGASGWDDVEFGLMTPGLREPVPVAKGASGGELSRVMLALEVIVAGCDPVDTYVFDEVDAGVGGAAALEVGRRLARLAEEAQVIVVTHLAQVAAFADAHLMVAKTQGELTSSAVRRLDSAEREAELARMMAGLAESDLARASGAELLALARSFRSGVDAR